MKGGIEKPRGRRSRHQWQELVDIAHALLAIDASRQFGLITGGPVCNNERCEQMLRDGAARGFRPSPDAIERFGAASQDEPRPAASPGSALHPVSHEGMR